jgi:hypothetical protein
MEARVLNYFEGSNNKEALAGLSDVDYIFYGPRERKLGNMLIGSDLKEVFSAQDLQIFEIGARPANSSGKSGELISFSDRLE